MGIDYNPHDSVMELWEILSDAIEEVAEWDDYEADMLTNPYGG